MNNTKKIIAAQTIALVAVFLMGMGSAHASVFTGTISSGATSSGSTTGGTVGGSTTGGSTVSGTVGGGSGGSSISGTVGGGGGGGGGGGSTIGGSVGQSSGGGGGGGTTQNNPTGGLVLGAQTIAQAPGLPNTGFGPQAGLTENIKAAIAVLVVLLAGALATVKGSIHP